MPLTRESLVQMRENELRAEVLIPLFRAMHFKDVHHYHGGALEQGKDIVMWKPGELRPRENYAVVAKRGDITGQAAGSGSAAEVATQVQQCFGKSFLDPTTAEPRNVDKCLVVASGKIPKEAINSLESVLSANRCINNTDFIDGDKLWELVQKYLPEKVVWQLLAQANKVIEEVASDFDVSVSMQDDRTSITLKPKEGKQIAPLRIQFPPDVPDEVKAEFRQKINDLIAKGSPVVLNSTSIKYLELPVAITSLLDTANGSAFELKQSIKRKPMAFNVKRESQDNRAASVDNLSFDYVSGGTEEFTVSNNNQNVPWKFEMVIRRPPNPFTMSFKVMLDGTNVFQVLQWYRFQDLCSKPGTLYLQDVATGMVHSVLPDAGVCEMVNPELLSLVEKLVYIQDRTRFPIKFTWDFTGDDEFYIDEVHQILRTGYGLEIASLSCELECSDLAQLGKFASPSSISLDVAQNAREVFGSKIELGPMRIHGERVIATAASLDAAHESMSAKKEIGFVKLEFVGASKEDVIKTEYTQWLPKDT